MKKFKINIAIISAVFLIFVLVLVSYIFAKFYPEQIYNFLLQNYSKLGYVANLDNPDIFQQMVLKSFQNQTTIGVIFISTSAIIILLLWNGFKGYLIKSVILGFIVIDLLLFSSKVNTWRSFDELIDRSNPISNKLKNELNYNTGRVYTFNNFWSDLMPNQLMPHHIPEANGFASLPIKRFEKWQGLAESKWSKESLLFKLGSVKYIYSLRDGKPTLSSIDDSLPRAYVTNHWITAKTPPEAFNFLSDENFDPNTVIIETDEIKGSNQTKNLKLTPAKISVYRSDYVKITSQSSDEGILVLTDTNYPGWQAYLNGKRVPVYSANYLFRGVKIPSGLNTLEFKYQPTFLNIGFMLSIGSVLLILFSARKY